MMTRVFSIGIALLIGSSCGDSGNGDNNNGDAAHTDSAAICTAGGPVMVTLTTDDGVKLIADHYSTGTTGAPGVLLLHMIPPGNSKANYTSAFIDPLVAKGFDVLNINRRGATGSDGDAMDAYQGDKGKLDAKAGYDYLVAHVCRIDAMRIAVVGASNGTTTATDFSVFAASAADTEQPKALVFLSGGIYTENQHALGANLTVLGAHPVYFAYPPGESAWNEGIQSIAPANWQFVEYSPGAHGTGLVGSNPEVAGDVAGFLEGAVL